MFAISRHPDCTAVSFQEAHALAPLLKNSGGPTSLNAGLFTEFPVVTEILLRSLALACANNEAFLTRFSLNTDGFLIRRIISTTPSDAFHFSEIEAGDSLEDPCVAEQILAFYKTSFGFEDAHWLRVWLGRTRDGSSVLVIRMPHLISDAASLRLLITEIWGYYERLIRGETVTPAPARFSLRDYVGSQQAWAATADFENQFNGLLRHTQDGLDALDQTSGRTGHQPLPMRPSAFCRAKLPQTVQTQIARLATQLKASPNLLLMAATAVFYSRVSGQRDFCFRMPFSGRTASGTEKIVGFLSNDLPMFVHIREDDSFLHLVRKIQRESLAVMRYGAIPWHRLTERLSESHPITAFDDYLVNVLSAAEHFGEDEAVRARSYPLPIMGKTNGILNILMHVLDSGARITMKVGEEDKDRLDHYLMPEFMRVVSTLACTPDAALKHTLDSVGPAT